MGELGLPTNAPPPGWSAVTRGLAEAKSESEQRGYDNGLADHHAHDCCTGRDHPLQAIYVRDHGGQLRAVPLRVRVRGQEPEQQFSARPHIP